VNTPLCWVPTVNLPDEIFRPPFACNFALPAHNVIEKAKKEARSMAPEKIMARQKMKNVTSEAISPMLTRLGNATTPAFIQKPRRNCSTVDRFNEIKNLSEILRATAIQKPYRICAAMEFFCAAVTFR
jgi:hypothetical protein